MNAVFHLIPAFALAVAPCSALAQEALAGASPEAAELKPISLDIAPEVLDALPADQRAILDEKVGSFVDILDKSKSILLSIKDKETADAAAPQLAALSDAFERLFGDGLSEDIPDELATLIELSLVRHIAKVQEVDDLVRALAGLEPPFYGSEALTAVCTVEEEMEVDMEYTEGGLAEAQVKDACSLMDDFLAAVEKTIGLLEGIEDKETADAAAAEIEMLMRDCEAKWDRFQVMEEAQTNQEELDDLLMERYGERLEAVQEMNKLLLRLQDRDPAFYGSAALEHAILPAYGDEDDGSDDGQTEEE